MKVALLVLALALPGAVAAQTPSAAAAPPAAAGAAGRVIDSLVTGRALAGAELWVDGVPTGTLTDSAGRYRLAELPAGWHTLSFAHPVLDSLGVAAPLVRVELLEPELMVDLATPSASTFHVRACGLPPGVQEGLLVGVVEDAETERPAPGATVEVAWLEFMVAKGGLDRVPRSTRVRADSSGRFAICFVPADVSVGLSASAGDARSGAVDVELGPAAFAVRRVSLGRSDAVVTGVVRDTAGKPVAGARASLADGALEATADSLGAFRLSGVPAGSRTIEVRAVGFSPTRVPVVARGSRPAHVEVTVGRTQILPTIAIVGKERAAMDVQGFEERRTNGHSGYFLTQEDIQKRRPVDAMDVFRAVPGIRVQMTSQWRPTLVMPRGGIGGCTPTIYLDGMVMQGGAFDLNTFVRAHEISAVEVYPGFASVPNDFRVQGSTCGVVLVWTRTR